MDRSKRTGRGKLHLKSGPFRGTGGTGGKGAENERLDRLLDWRSQGWEFGLGLEKQKERERRAKGLWAAREHSLPRIEAHRKETGHREAPLSRKQRKVQKRAT